MGFVRANVLPLLKEHSQRPCKGSLLLLGQADVYFTYSHLMRMAKIAGVKLDESVAQKPSRIPLFAEKGYIDGETLFKSIGFSEISVLDYSAFEGATFQHDLNSDNVPSELENRFDVIIDHGTLEHVFHFPNALNNLFRMLRTGGRVIHSSPSGNFFDHGFYMFQPTLFVDFYSANKWIINSIQIAQFTPNQEIEPPFFLDYEPGLFESLSYGKMDNKLYATVCIATKTAESSGTRIPQQGLYARMGNWKNSTTPSDVMTPPSLKQRIKGFFGQ